MLYLTIALSVAMLLFTGVVSWFMHGQVVDSVSDYVTQLSQVITRSTRFAMLQNQPAYVDRIIHDVANQEKIHRVRIISNEGRVIFSTHAPEVGQTVNLAQSHLSARAASPQRAHLDIQGSERPVAARQHGNHPQRAVLLQCRLSSPLQGDPRPWRARHRLFARYRSTRNCAPARLGIATFSIGFVVIASLAVGFFIHRLVYLPLRDLESGAHRLSTGDLDQPIPVRSADEFGKLAISFNGMTEALRKSRGQLREWAHTLEQKVDSRTQELRRAQAETMRGEKLASVGLLASGVAHELNNPLTGILTFSHLLRQKMPDKSADAEDMDLVIRETKRCAAIIKRLLDFAREKQPEKKFTDINQVIEDTVRIVERPAHLRDIEINMDLDRTLPPIWIDADQIKQVVMNMLVNAQHAVEEKGSIAISTRRADTPRITPQSGQAGTRWWRSPIADTGCGIPEENLRRIFDPFFTSKAVGKGTGLGLSVSHGIVEGHGGLIEVQSKVGEGSTFRVFLPLAVPAGGADTRGGGRARQRTERERLMSARILVVDDEEIVIRSCLRILEGSDYQIEVGHDGREALQKVEQNGYDILILDIMMPNIGGMEVLRRVKESHPDIDVIMITGLSQIDTAVQAMKLGAFDYISKPFEPDELKMVVQRALERRQLMQENLNLKTEVSSKYRFENIIGSSPQMQAVYRLVAQCAPTNSTVLLTGESGTGKELIARAIHYNSLRKDKPFVPVDCNSLSENLLESELFGHVKGAFTGAVTSKKGMFEVAESGSLFLDEIGNFSLGDPGQDAARVAGARIPRGRRHQDADRQFPADHRHQQGPQGHGRRRHIPRRPVLPHQHLPDPCARAARSQGRHSARSPTISSRRSAPSSASRSPRFPRAR